MLAAETASELASAVAKEFATLAVGSATEPNAAEPEWTTRHDVALELESVRLRDFSAAHDGIASLICAPYALHGSTIADFAAGHSLVAALRDAGLKRIFATDWRSAGPDMRFFSIDTYLADLNVLVDELGGKVDLIGLCQGGWLVLIYAARFRPRCANWCSRVPRSTTASAPPACPGSPAILPSPSSRSWSTSARDGSSGSTSCDFGRSLNSTGRPFTVFCKRPTLSIRPRSNDWKRFRDWYAWTVDLPGTYYLQVVEQLFKEYRSAAGRFVALGRQVDLSKVRCPMFLLAARDDELVAAEQIFATEGLVGTPADAIRRTIAPGGHLGLFMGRATLSDIWPDIARWLARGERARGANVRFA